MPLTQLLVTINYSIRYPFTFNQNQVIRNLIAQLVHRRYGPKYPVS